MTIEQRADDAAVEHSGKRLVMLGGVPNGGDFFAIRKTFNPQALFIFHAAAETDAVGRVSFLERFFVVHNSMINQLNGKEKI